MCRLIECCNGVLKQRFRCLSLPLQFDLVFGVEIVKACCVLHNLIISSRQEDFELPEDILDNPVMEQMLPDNDDQRRAQNESNQIKM